MMMEFVVATSRIDGRVKRVSHASRVLDGVLVVVFAVLAWRADSALWVGIWSASAALCLFTAITGPIERVWSLLGFRTNSPGGGSVEVSAAPAPPINRQQRRAAARERSGRA